MEDRSDVDIFGCLSDSTGKGVLDGLQAVEIGDSTAPVSCSMSKKGPSAEANDEDKANGGSESQSQSEDKAERINLDSLALSDKTLQDLPIKLLQMIIIKAVVMEVKGLKLAKSVWEVKAHELVVSRLKTVCPQWSNLLATDSFRKDLQRTLEGTAQVIRLEILQESPLPLKAQGITSLNGELFMLCSQNETQEVIEVYDYNNLAEAKDVIALPSGDVLSMETCSVSQCLYVGIEDDSCDFSVFRISKTAENQFNVSSWIHDHELSAMEVFIMSVSVNGSIIILTKPNIVSIYDASGTLQYGMEFSEDDPFRYTYMYVNVIQRSNGNLVLGVGAFGDQDEQVIGLLEFDVDVTNEVAVKKYESSFSEFCIMGTADDDGRILLTEPFKRMELLDRELNLLGSFSLQKDEGKNLELFGLQYDTQRNEIVRVHHDKDANTKVLTAFRFIEE